MPVQKPIFLVLFAIAVVVAIVATAAYINEKNRQPSLEIRADKNGLRIEGQ
jgi:hypothetical protein